jgi:hypothetical protein
VIWTVAILWTAAMVSPIRRVEIEHVPALAGTRLSSATVVPANWELGCRVLGRGPAVRYELVTEMHWVGSKLGMMGGKQNRSIERVATGWPLVSMEWAGTMDQRRRYQSHAMPGVVDVMAGLAPPVRVADLYQGADRRLPLVPLWPGFVVDAMGWGLLGWISVLVVRGWRRRRRRRRGLCEVCAYPVAGCERCSECGHEIAAVAVAKSAAGSTG